MDSNVFPGNRVWVCETSYYAKNLFTNTNVHLNESDQVCYPTPNPTTSNLKYLTCFKRPVGKYFDFDEGVYVSNDSRKDQTPENIINDISQVCSDYSGERARFINVLNNQLSTQQVISSTSARIKYTTDQLVLLSTTYCTSQAKYQRLTDFCTTLNTGIQIYKSLPLGNYGLNYINYTMSNGILASTINLYSNVYLPGYKGFQCSVPG